MLIEPLFVQQIVDMYSAGKSQKEIVEATGQTYCVVRYWLKKKNLYDPSRRCRNTASAMQGIQKYNEHQKQEAETRLAFSLLEKGFAYLGGYNGKKDSEIRLSCLRCGKEFARHDLGWLLNGNIECPFCGDRAQQRAEHAREKEERRKNYEHTLEVARQKREKHKLELERALDEKHICKECGKEFTYRSYAQSIGVDPIFVQCVDYCSRECRKKNQNRKQRKYNYTHGKHRLRARKYGTDYDNSVNLEDLIKRDGLRCAICGEMCDPNDYKIINGVFVVGNHYPSMDHIIPFAKGGGHTWDNVQVAHLICNSKKGANIVA